MDTKAILEIFHHSSEADKMVIHSLIKSFHHDEYGSINVKTKFKL